MGGGNRRFMRGGGVQLVTLVQRAQQHIENRRQEQAEEGHAEHAEEDGDAHRVAHFRAGAGRGDERDDAHDEGDRGHQDRPQAQRLASIAAWSGVAPWISSSRANSTIRMAFLQASPTSTINPIWVKMLLSPPVRYTPVSAARACSSARSG
jgi:hypothetical protein